jgi:hypothetical protein
MGHPKAILPCRETKPGIMDTGCPDLDDYNTCHHADRSLGTLYLCSSPIGKNQTGKQEKYLEIILTVPPKIHFGVPVVNIRGMSFFRNLFANSTF